MRISSCVFPKYMKTFSAAVQSFDTDQAQLPQFQVYVQNNQSTFSLSNSLAFRGYQRLYGGYSMENLTKNPSLIYSTRIWEISTPYILVNYHPHVIFMLHRDSMDHGGLSLPQAYAFALLVRFLVLITCCLLTFCTDSAFSVTYRFAVIYFTTGYP